MYYHINYRGKLIVLHLGQGAKVGLTMAEKRAIVVMSAQASAYFHRYIAIQLLLRHSEITNQSSILLHTNIKHCDCHNIN